MVILHIAGTKKTDKKKFSTQNIKPLSKKKSVGGQCHQQ